MRGDCKQPSYVAKFPTALSPGLEVTFEDETSFRLTEATAIMQYLCEKKQLEKWWPSSSSTSVSAEQRAQLASYLSAHHGTTRKISHLCFFKLMRFLMDPKKNFFDPENARDVTLEKATDFQRVWLKPFMAGVGTDEAYFNTDDAPATFIAGMSHPTIADLIAYVEIAQVQQMDILKYADYDLPQLNRWLQAMQQLPHHDDVHRSLGKLCRLYQSMTPAAESTKEPVEVTMSKSQNKG